MILWGAYLELEHRDGMSSADYALNTYISKLSYVNNKSEFFNNHDIYSEPIPPNPYWGEGTLVKYSFNKV